MDDLFYSAVARNEFQRWLDIGTAPFTIWQGEQALVTLSRLEKQPGVDYLYRISPMRDNSISWDSDMQFCGVYDTEHRALYLTKDSLGKFPFVAETGLSMAGEISDRINRYVEEIIANDPNNLQVREITGCRETQELQYYQNYGAKEDAVRTFFDGEVPDGQFCSGYEMDGLREAAFIAYIQDPEGYIQAEAERYMKINQEKFLLQFLENEALLAEYQALMQDTGSPIHRMKAITDAVKASGAKTVTVTVQKEGQELAFKTAANSLTGHKSYYSAYDISAPDRREFERLFGRHSDYKAEDITSITYGRSTIYEAPAVQTEEIAEAQGPTLQMGGM